MSHNPKAVQSSATDPLVEALDRLERSMAGASGASQAVMAPPRTAPEIPAARPQDANKAPATAPPARTEPRPLETVPQPSTPPAPNRSAAVSSRTAPAVRGFADDELISALEDRPAPGLAPSRRGNRRSRRGFWFAVVAFGIIQCCILALAAMIAWPIMKRSLVDEASQGVQGGKEISAALIARVGTGEEKIDDLKGRLELMDKRLSVTPENAWQELDYLKGRNNLVRLGDRAIQAADRKALERLKELAVTAPEERIRSGALAEILRVKSAYQIGLRSGSHTLPVGQLFPSLRGKDELALSTDQLIKVLLDAEVRPEYRLKSAYLLADRRGGKAADALASAVASDPDLDVVREAAMTFSEMTGYRTTDLFDSEGLIEWWQNHAARVKAVLGG